MLRRIRKEAVRASTVEGVLQTERQQAAADWLARNEPDLNELEIDGHLAEQAPEGVSDIGLPVLADTARRLVESYRSSLGDEGLAGLAQWVDG